MKGFFVTIVDILGVFIPGFLLLLGLLLLPWIFNDLTSQSLTWVSFSETIKVNGLVLAIVVAIVAYVLGFLLRLWSIYLLEKITRFRWGKNLKERADMLNKAIESAINDEKLCKALKDVSEAYGGRDLTTLAPYFHFAKRVVRSSSPSLWAETERLEAEIRFASGLFIPFCILAFDGLFLKKPLGYMISTVSIAGALTIWTRFPHQRIKEVIYDYLLAIIVLRYKPKLEATEKEE